MPKSIMMANIPLPWVDGWNHLGNELNRNDLCWQGNSNLDHDTNNKRRKFIGKCHSLRQEFGFLKLDIFLKIVNIYATSFYGSNVWSLSSLGSEKLYVSWNRMIRNIWNVPNTTHRYLIEIISNSNHIKLCIFKRYLTFINSLKTSKKKSLASLANNASNDKHSITCQNLDYISNECNLDAHNANPSEVLQSEYHEVPVDEVWRVEAIKELLEIRNGNLILGNDQFSKDDITDMIDLIATT